MYKRQVNSAVGRVRPDLARVADGIAASLRQFSISARRSVAEDGNRAPPPSPPSRTQRSASATREVSDLAPPPPPPSRGIDARSLAAKPPSSQGFTIRRYVGHSGGDGGRGGGGAFNTSNRSPSTFNTSNRSPSAFPPRAPFRGGGMGATGMRGGAGGFRGRGGGGPRGRGGVRGRNARGPRDKKPKFAEEADFEILPYTEEEMLDYNTIVGGFPESYNPITSHASLAGWGPSVISSQQGLKEVVDAKLGVAVNRKFPGWNLLEWHKKKITEGGLTVFKDVKEREMMREWQRGKGLASTQYVALSEVQKKKLSSQWIGGHYDGPVAVDRKDVLGQVAKYARANGTYLAEETKQFEQDVAKLLPASLKPKPVKSTP